MSNGVRSAVIGDGMTRAPVVRMPSAIDARFVVHCHFLIKNLRPNSFKSLYKIKQTIYIYIYLSFLLTVIMWTESIFFSFSELKMWMEDNFTSLKELFDETSR